MYIRLIGFFDHTQKGIEDVDVKMVIYYMILADGKNIVQCGIYDDQIFVEHLLLSKCN